MTQLGLQRRASSRARVEHLQCAHIDAVKLNVENLHLAAPLRKRHDRTQGRLADPRRSSHPIVILDEVASAEADQARPGRTDSVQVLVFDAESGDGGCREDNEDCDDLQLRRRWRKGRTFVKVKPSNGSSG